jgi:hypothetical protein
MKTTSLQAVATRYNMTLGRAAYDILAACGLRRRAPGTHRIRRQSFPPALVKKAEAYVSRTTRQHRAGYYGVCARSWWPMKNGHLTAPLP